MPMKDSTFLRLPSLIARLLSGGALRRADSRHVASSPVKRVDSLLSSSLSWMSRGGIR
jgi:hypothetical protein